MSNNSAKKEDELFVDEGEFFGDASLNNFCLLLGGVYLPVLTSTYSNEDDEKNGGDSAIGTNIEFVNSKFAC